MKTWEKNIRRVEPYVPGEQPKVKDVVKLNTNENPYPPTPKVLEAAERMNISDLRHYTDPDYTECEGYWNERLQFTSAPINLPKMIIESFIQNSSN